MSPDNSLEGYIKQKAWHQLPSTNYPTTQLPTTNYHLPTTNYECNRQDRIGVSAADTATDEGARDVADGAGATDERVAAVHNESASPGRELLLPHGGEARERTQDGLLPGAPSAG